MSLTVMVTGAGGFVGLNLVERLLGRGESVLGLSPEPLASALDERFSALPGRLSWVVGDVRDGASMRGAIRDHAVTAIAHMAAITPDADRERRAAEAVIDVNLVGLAAMLAAAADSGVERFVYTGSIAVFGPQTPDGGLLEEDTPHDPRTLYAITKSAGEALVARLGDLHGLDWVIARLGRVFGPYEHDTGVRDTLSQIYQATLSARAGRAVRFARPCVKNWNYARDIAADLDMLLSAPSLPHRVYNLGAPHAWSLADWCARLAERMEGFHYVVGEDAAVGETIDLWGPRDGSLLSWGRFEKDFERAPPRGLDAAFEDYIRFLDEGPAMERA
jgi:UDP-glucuronate 4-epimerase